MSLKKASGTTAASNSKLYVDDVFSSYVYTGNSGGQHIKNDIKLGSTLEWSTYTISNPSGYIVYDSVTDALGNLYQTGYVNSTIKKGVIVKYDSSFNMLWQKELSTTYTNLFERVVLDSSGNIFIAGRENDSASEGKLFLLKLDSVGAFVWKTQIVSTRTSYPGGISVDSLGNVRVSGYTQLSVSTQSFVMKFDSNGALLWQNITSNKMCESRGKHAVDSSGNMYVGLYTSDASYHAFGVIQKWDASGNFVWQKSLDLPSWGGGFLGNIVIDSSNYLYASGTWNVEGTSSAVIVRYSLNGDLIWKRNYYTNSLESSFNDPGCLTTDGTYVYISCFANGSLAGYSYPITLFKVDSSGTTQWKKTFGSSINTQSLISSIVFNSTYTQLFISGKSFNASPYPSYIISVPANGNFNGVATFNVIEGIHSDFNWSSGTASDASLSRTTGTYTVTTPSYTLSSGTGYTISLATQSAVTGSGGLVWIKSRDQLYGHRLVDSNRSTKYLDSSNSSPENAATDKVKFGINGFTLSPNSQGSEMNNNAVKFASWTFRKAEKFFDITTVVHTNGASSNVPIPPNQSDVGFSLVKNTSATGDWYAFHRSLGQWDGMRLNSTTGVSSLITEMVCFTPGNIGIPASAPSGTYVAYFFYHNTAADGMIQCGSFTTDGSGNATVTLGWEPQYVMIKALASGTNWWIIDTMRGWSRTDFSPLYANSATNEAPVGVASIFPTATGFNTVGTVFDPSTTFIYMAIRRSNKPPTTGTQVYNAITRTGTAAAATVTGVGFPPDLAISHARDSGSYQTGVVDRLRGFSVTAFMDSGQPENAYTNVITATSGDGYTLGADNSGCFNFQSGIGYITWLFKRAPGFFDEVCWTGTGTSSVVNHNLTVPPELYIEKCRSTSEDWYVTLFSPNTFAHLNLTTKFNYLGIPLPTSTQFTTINGTSGRTNVSYLFATLAGISKVGSYTGNGSTQNIDCGFAAGARFVLIKRTDSAGDWYVWDSARGIIEGNDLHLSLNSTVAEVTADDSIDPYSPGFTVNQVAATNINVTSATYIYLAIA